MEILPIEIVQKHIFIPVLNEFYNKDIRKIRSLSIVCKLWRDIIVSNDFINLILSEREFKHNKPNNFKDMKSIERFNWLINEIYCHKKFIKQEKHPFVTSEYDLLQSYMITVTGNVDDIYLRIPNTDVHYENEGKMINVYKNEDNHKKVTKISININPPLYSPSMDNNWIVNLEIDRCEILSDGSKMKDFKVEPIYKTVEFINKYEFKIIGDCTFKEKDLWTHLPVYT